MKKLFLIIPILALTLSLTGCGSSQPIDKEPIFFYSDSCGHCQNVEKYMAENLVVEQYPLVQKEVSKDRANANLFAEKAKECNITEMGVPLLYDMGKCYQGEDRIINHFKEKIGL